MDLSALEAKYGKLKLGGSSRGSYAAPTIQQPKKKGGIGGFIDSAVRGVAHPFGYLLDTAIGNPTRELAADFSHNKVAAANAKARTNKTLGLGESGTDIGNALKTLGGNSAQALLTVAAPATSSIKKNAAMGAGFGASSALAKPDSSLNDVITGGVEGGALGGALGLGGKVASKFGKAKPTEPKAGFMQNLTTQGQQMQARGLGLSGGNKAAGKELFPQDTESMLQTLKSHEIPIKNANSVARNVQDKLTSYGKQIGDHFKANDNELKPTDTEKIGENFMSQLHTTDPRIAKEAQVLVNDLNKNVKSTKGLWEFRKSLDSRIPDTKFASDQVSNKIAAIKDMRNYISKELGDVPGMSDYHDLIQVKPFLAKGMRELNQPSGGIAGRVLSSGPIQKAEALVGKGVEKIGRLGTSEAPQIAEQAQPNILSKLTSGVTTPSKGFMGNLVTQAGARELTPTPQAPEDPNAQARADFFNGNGFNVDGTPLDAGASTEDSSQTTEDTSNDPFAPENVKASVAAILKQGGTMKDVSDFLSIAKAQNELTATKTPKGLNSTQQQQANNANSGIDSLNTIANILKENPNAAKLAHLPGGSLAGKVTHTGEYKAAVANATDVVGRLRSGGAINADEEKRFLSLLPGAFDDQDTVKYKLNSLYSLFSRFANPTDSTTSDAQDALAEAGL